MKPSHFCRLIVVSGVLGFISPLVSGQGLSPDQIYGRDIANSLAPGPPRRGKEKTEQVDAQKLRTEKVTDTKFQGSLLDVGLGSTADTKSHEEKPRSGSDKERASKTADAAGDKEKASKSTDVGGDGHNKDQKATSTRPNEKTSGSPTEKASASKADGTR
jgi:hypothetical protein